jgi:hypothetical protein
MDESGAPALFLGELDDPWVAAIADALPQNTLRIASYGDLPEEWPELVRAVRTLILHRSVLTATDAERLRQLRTPEGQGPRVILCVGAYARYHQLARWTPLVDLMLPESIASEVIRRHVGETRSRTAPQGSRAQVVVLSTNHEMRQMLAETCRESGYSAITVRDWSEVRPGGTVIWDVPVLEEEWSDVLKRESNGRRVLCMLGFADRASVALARAQGAAACLELPFEVADLVFVLDRVVTAHVSLADPPHTLPPAPARFRVVRHEADDAETRR